MKCAGTDSVLDLYCEARLTPSRAAAVKAHLESCPLCRAKAAALRPAPPKAPPAPIDLKERLRAALSAPALAAQGSDAPQGGDARAVALTLGAFAAALWTIHFLTRLP